MREHIKADEIVEIAPQVHPTGTRFSYEDGTEISFKSACNSCGYSLYWCKCDPPKVLGKVVVVSTNKEP
jgi:hypothetical protein